MSLLMVLLNVFPYFIKFVIGEVSLLQTVTVEVAIDESMLLVKIGLNYITLFTASKTYC